jgi:ATP-dependent RNA helicase DeaD
MTEIQEKAIPLLLEGRDVIGKSNTGTGKTAAFSLPIIERISQEEKGFVHALILCPTRELAMQACEEVVKFARFKKWIKPVAVYGGASMERQIHALKNGANIVIGTPGRVLDHLRRRTLKLQNLRTIVLDEADEMLNMGFREDIETVLAQIPEERQTVLFSATMPPAILQITKQYQTDPVMVQIQSAARTVDSIEQFYVSVPMGRKTDALHLLLTDKKPNSAMIFCNTKKMVDELTEALISRGFAAIGLHGDMKQSQRTQVMNSVKSGRSTILIATDVAARGIDVKGIDMVFNYDLPQDHEYYIHRIGRTGRAGKCGTAYSIVSGRKQEFELRDISRYTKATITEVPVPTASEIRASAMQALQERILESCNGDISPEATALAQRLLETGQSAEALLSAILQQQVADTMKVLPLFDVPRPISRKNGRKQENRNTVRVHINVGRKERMAPNFILGALVDATGLSGSDFGKIDIYDQYTTVEVPKEESAFIIDSMQQEKINGHKVSVKLHEERSGKHESFGKRNDRRGGKSYNGRNSARDRRPSNTFNHKKRKG